MDRLELMNRDECIGVVMGGALEVRNEALLPLYLRRTANFEEWLTMRAIDAHRTNSRLLKRALRLKKRDDISTVLHFNAATITDAWWVRRDGENLQYADVCFQRNYFDKLALRGDADSFNQPPSRTPELTNTGSFEKCWTLSDGHWWLCKAGNAEERFTEVLSSKLANVLGIPAVQYEARDGFVACRDFTNGAQVNFETAFGLIGDAADYLEIYDALDAAGSLVQRSYAQMCFFDALLFNMDRHEHNFGVLRDVETGEVLSMAPLYDHNIALITRGYRSDICREHDLLIDDFLELVSSRSTGFSLPVLTKQMVRSAAESVAVPLSGPDELCMSPLDYVADFIFNAYARIAEELGR